MSINKFLRLIIFCIYVLIGNATIVFGQTTLSPGDIAVIGFKTSTSTETGNDAVQLVTMVDLTPGTTFIITDNNWNSATSSWACNDDEMGAEVTVTSTINAGSIIYVEMFTAGGVITSSSGSLTIASLGSPWGTNWGFNSGGDNVFILTGTRLSPNFIFAYKHVGAFANSACTNKDQTGLPTSLNLGITAIVMSSSKDQWNYKCSATLSGTKSILLAAISNNNNWTNAKSTTQIPAWSWSSTTCAFSVCIPAIAPIVADTFSCSSQLLIHGPSPSVTYSWNKVGSVTYTTGNSFTVTDFSIDTTFYYVREVVGSCKGDSTKFKVVSIQRNGGALSSTSTTVCSSSNVGVINLSGYKGNVLSWITSTNNFNTINNLSNTLSVYHFNNLNTSTSYKAIVKNGKCPSDTSGAITIIVTPTAIAPIVADAFSCNSQPLTINGPNNTKTYSWNKINTGIYTNGNSFSITYFASDTTNYYIREIVGNCKGDSTLFKVINYPRNGGSLTTSSSAVCFNSNSGTINLAGYKGNVISWISSFDNFNSNFNNLVNTSPIFNFNNLNISTSYKAIVKNGNCPSDTSTSISINVIPIAPAPIVADTFSCNSQPVTIIGLNSSSMYSWNKLNSGTYTNGNFLSITDFTRDTTLYYVREVVGNCKGDSTIFRVINFPRNGGMLSSASTSVCLGANSGTINLSGYKGNILSWISSTDNFITNNNTLYNTLPNYSFNSLNVSTSYRTIVKNGNCPSDTSAAINIHVGPTIPAPKFADTFTCKSRPLTLNGPNSLVTYSWNKQNSNVSTNGNSFTITDFSNDTSFYYIREAVGNCDVDSTLFKVISIPSNGGALSAAVTEVCLGANTGTINLSGYLGNVISWISSSDNFTSNLNSLSNALPDYNFNNINISTSYKAIVKNGNCPLDTSSSLTIIVKSVLRDGGTLSSLTQEVCIDSNSGTIDLSGYQGNVLSWISSTDNFKSDVNSISNLLPEFQFKNLNKTTTFKAIVQNDICPSDTSLPITIQVNPSTTPGNIEIASLDNSSLVLKGLVGEVKYWESSSDNFSTYSIIPQSNNVTEITGSPKLFYRALVQSSPCAAKYTDVVDLQIIIYSTISPNNDRLNDTWIIDGIEHFPMNRVRIFNRWGQLLYSQEGYNNRDKVWKGDCVDYISGTLPDGTYFYEVELFNKKFKTGFIELKR